MTLASLLNHTNVRAWWRRITWWAPVVGALDLDLDAEALCAELLHREARR
jgi:hypothetical protein